MEMDFDLTQPRQKRIAPSRAQTIAFDAGADTINAATALTYRSAMKRYLHICAELGIKDWSAAETIVQVIQRCVEEGYAPQTIQTTVWATRHFLSNEQVDNTRTRMVLKALKNARIANRECGRRRHLALRINDVIALMETSQSMRSARGGASNYGLVTRAFFACLYAGGFRYNELRECRMEDIKINKHRMTARILIRHRKNDQYAKGHQVFIADENFGDLKPVQRLLHFLEFTPPRQSIAPFFLLPRTYDTWDMTRALGKEQIRRTLKQLLKHAGYDESKYGTHSFRRGLITDLASMNMSPERIIAISGHNSSQSLPSYTMLDPESAAVKIA
jgi:site-specific recombinase XerD